MAVTAGIKLLHPLAFVPVIVYVVLVFGETTELPPLYVYVTAPVGDNVKLCPLQMLPPLTANVGEVNTFMVEIAAAALTQPAELVPITE